MVFGLSNVGKTTVVQNMQLNYGFFDQDFRQVQPAFYDDEFRQSVAIEDIRKNVHEGIRNLCDKALEENSGYEFESEETRQLAEDLTSKEKFDRNFPYQQIWRDAGIQRAYIHTNQYDQTQNLQYFMKHIDRICQEDFTPTETDGLHIRKRTIEPKTYRIAFSSEFALFLVCIILQPVYVYQL